MEFGSIHCSCLCWEVEKGGVKVAYVLIEKASSFDICGVEVVGPRVVVAVNVEPVFRDPTPTSLCFRTELPQSFRIGSTATEAARHADNGNRYTGVRHGDDKGTRLGDGCGELELGEVAKSVPVATEN